MVGDKAMLNVWVTGATSGIGLALTRELSHQGCRVFISARDEVKLKQIAAGMDNIIPIPFDITCEQAIPAVQDQILRHTETLQQVFINAGSCEYLDIDAPDWSMVKRITDINLIGAVNTVAVALPFLQKQESQKQVLQTQAAAITTQRPQIIGISSMATLMPFPKSQAYGASKAGLNYFLQSLRVDLRAQNISVTTVLPGFVKTPLTDKNTFDMPFIMDTELAAKRIIKGVSSHPRIFAFPKRLYWILCFFKLFPSVWENLVSPKEVSSKEVSQKKTSPKSVSPHTQKKKKAS
jgi:short-subunit dehydrogenase